MRRDRASLALSFLLPVAFFSIIAMVFCKAHDSIPKVHVIVVDEVHSIASRKLLRGLMREGSLAVSTRPEPKDSNLPDFTTATAESAVRTGKVPVALVIPAGWGAHPLAFGSDQAPGPEIELLSDQSDPVAPQIVGGLLQKAAMTSMPSSMASEGGKYMQQYLGGLTSEQEKRWNAKLSDLHNLDARSDAEPLQPADATQNSSSGSGAGFSDGFVHVKTRGIIGEHQNKNQISFYAAGMGVMFLLFTASGAAGSLLDEQDSGTLDRILSSHITMTTLLAGKLTFNTLLAFSQLVVMFLWGWAVFHLDFFQHIPGFIVMGLCTAFAVASFGMFLASICRTRAQLGALSTLLIMIMSSVGGSMFPRYLMPEAVQKAGLFTINAWAIDGFTKVFWRDMPVTALGPQVGVLLAAGLVLFLVARRFARRWEMA